MKRKKHEGTDITVTFDMSRRIHKRTCFLKLPVAFDSSQRPWVHLGKTPVDETADLQCLT